MTRDDSPIAAPMQRILQCVLHRTGLCFRPTQLAQTTSAVSRAMQRAGESQPNDYAARLETDLATLDDLIVELVVGETYFFRIPEQFDFIRETVANHLRDRDDKSRPLRVWSAGCASGEEPYSLAILFEEMGILERTHILATDISRVALDRAKQGRYREWSFRGADALRAKRQVTPDGDEFALRKELLRAVHFAYLNLALDVYPSFVTGTRDVDLILCRNVLIYFDRDTIGRVAQRFYDSLTPGGWLITAASDPPLDDAAPFEAVNTRGGIYYRRPLRSDVTTLTTSRQDGSTFAAAQEYSRVEAEPPDDTMPDGKASLEVTSSERQRELIPSLDEIRASLLAGNYDQVVALTESRLDSPAACVLHVKALSNDDAVRAERVCRSLVDRHSLSAELHYLHAVLLMERRRDQDALSAARKTLYLDRSLAIAHFTLGALARRMGDSELALRAFRNAREMCRNQPASDVVCFADDETYGSLSRAVELQLASLGEKTGDGS
ncbi:MAG: CheR family methyltransferase [Planctomycetota bacterium]